MVCGRYDQKRRGGERYDQGREGEKGMTEEGQVKRNDREREGVEGMTKEDLYQNFALNNSR